jgi:hypothetical protein
MYRREPRGGADSSGAGATTPPRQVLLLKNVCQSQGLINGSRGVVVGFRQHKLAGQLGQTALPVVRFADSTGSGSDPIERLVVGRRRPTSQPALTIGGVLGRGRRQGHGVTRGHPRTHAPSHRRVQVPEEWSLIQGGKVQMARTQIPLRLAWAITIHKCGRSPVPGARKCPPHMPARDVGGAHPMEPRWRNQVARNDHLEARSLAEEGV